MRRKLFYIFPLFLSLALAANVMAQTKEEELKEVRQLIRDGQLEQAHQKAH